MEPELFMLNKYLKKMFPFIIEVSDLKHEKSRRGDIWQLDIYVSPLHFCELMDYRIDKKIRSIMIKESYTLINSLLPESKEDDIRILFYPNIDKVTIFDNIPVM